MADKSPKSTLEIKQITQEMIDAERAGEPARFDRYLNAKIVAWITAAIAAAGGGAALFDRIFDEPPATAPIERVESQRPS